MQRLLITGVDTVVGSNLALALADRFDVFGLPTNLPCKDGAASWVEPRDTAVQLTRSICEAHPQWVIHCSDLSTNSWDLHAPHIAHSAAVETAGHVAELSASLAARLTVIVSDGSFSGPRVFHEENSTDWSSDPIAARIAQVERLCSGPHTLIVRTHAYGWSPSSQQPCFAEQLVTALSGGAEIRAPGMHYATPILASDLADLLVGCLQRQLTGTVHLSGAERTNQFRFACELAKSLGMASPRVKQLASDDLVPATETSLRTHRTDELQGIRLPLLREGLERFAAQHRSGWQQKCGWRPCPAALIAQAA
jgi:dTDP-4-dehydrorhamnose reductase